ncbi:MAG: hypothetical protein L3J79_03500, partial [Candidatus Marinimicrobia bacterium]|nr:hypothetical protein [Candidatus Neomarinimicrobiota bacterium]
MKQIGGIISSLALFSFIFFFSYSLLYPPSEALTKIDQDKPLLERLASYNLQGYKASQSTVFDITKNVVGE